MDAAEIRKITAHLTRRERRDPAFVVLIHEHRMTFIYTGTEESVTNNAYPACVKVLDGPLDWLHGLHTGCPNLER